MKFENACETAMEYFKKEYGDVGLLPVFDTGDSWVFSGRNAKNEALYGKQSIMVNKTTGKQTVFYLPDEENFKLLDKATEIQVPKEYRI